MADLSVTAANVLFTSGSKESSYNAGEAITAGMGVYLSASNTWLKAQCDGTAIEAGLNGLGISLHAAGTGQPLSVALTGSTINIGGTTTKNTVYFVSAAAGAVMPVADLATGNRIARLGYATATDGTFVVDTKYVGATAA